MGAALFAAAQTAYQPKFPGDPAHSDSEAIALGYMRTVLRAQHTYKVKNGKYADSLADLVHTGTIHPPHGQPRSRRLHRQFPSPQGRIRPAAYTQAAWTPDHRSFYAKEDGVIHGDEQKAADENSPRVK